MFKLRKILQIKCICLKEKPSFLVVTTITLSYNAEIEHVGQTHLQLAQIMRDEAKKLEDFRERQKDTKKKVSQRCEPEGTFILVVTMSQLL